MDFEGPPEALLERTLKDLKRARREGPPHASRDRAFVSLVERYRLDPPEERALRAFLDKSAKRLAALPPTHAASFLLKLDHYVLLAETDTESWLRVSLHRSAIQVIIDDYAHTPVPGWFDAESLEETDAHMRTAVLYQWPIPRERIPAALTATGRHWWWTLPESRKGYLAYGRWPGLNLAGERLVEAILEHAKCPGANFDGADAYAAQAPGIVLTYASLVNTRFSKADLTKADFVDANATGAQFNQATLTRARFDRAKLRGASFVGADLRGASFVDADLTDANLTHADLRGAELRGAQLDSANLTSART